MPFRRNYRRRYTRRRPRKAQPWYNRRYTPLGLAKKAMAGVWKLKGLVNSEKFKYDMVGFTRPIATGVTLPLHEIALGDGDAQRTGNSIYVRSVNINCILNLDTRTINGVQAPIAQTIRLAIIQDTQTVSDAGASINNIYEGGSGILAHLNSAFAGRYKVLWTNTYSLSYHGNQQKFININVPMRHHIRYNGPLSTDIQKGGLYFAQIGSDDTFGIECKYEARLTYHDN